MIGSGRIKIFVFNLSTRIYSNLIEVESIIIKLKIGYERDIRTC